MRDWRSIDMSPEQQHDALTVACEQDLADELRASLEQLLSPRCRAGASYDTESDEVSRFAAAALLRALLAIDERLSRFEELIVAVHEAQRQPPAKQWYTVGEVAEMLGRAEFTVREWCRLGRVYASKRACGRGNAQEWIISDEEIERIRNEGLLPM